MSSSFRALTVSVALGLSLLATSACRTSSDTRSRLDSESAGSSTPAEGTSDAAEQAAAEHAPDPRLMEGVAAIQAGNTQAGVEILEASLLELPTARDRADAETWLAHAWTVLGDYEQTRDHARAAIALRPKDPWLHYALGLALLGTGQDDGAIAALTRSIELDEAPIKALQWRSEVHFRNDRWELALADCNAALEVIAAATDAQVAAAGATRQRLEYDTLFDKIKALDGLQRYDEARAARERARELGP